MRMLASAYPAVRLRHAAVISAWSDKERAAPYCTLDLAPKLTPRWGHSLVLLLLGFHVLFLMPRRSNDRARRQRLHVTSSCASVVPAPPTRPHNVPKDIYSPVIVLRNTPAWTSFATFRSQLALPSSLTGQFAIINRTHQSLLTYWCWLFWDMREK